MLNFTKLSSNAVTPTVAHPGEDLAFDFYASDMFILPRGKVTKVSTDITARYISSDPTKTYGLILADRSSMASKGITISAGVIDAGYSDHILVMMTYNGPENEYVIHAGDKIVQAVPTEVLTDCEIVEVDALPSSSRGARGFGSSGR